MRPRHLQDAQRQGVQRRLEAALRNVPEVVVAYLHGSFVAGTFRDVDIGVLVRSEPAAGQALRLEISLSRRLEEDVGLPVDVRVLNHAPPFFRFNVIRARVILLSRDERARADFESRTLSEHHDFLHHRRAYQRESLGLTL